MRKFYRISEAAKVLGVHPATLRRWEKEKRLIPNRTEGRQRLYESSQLDRLARLSDSKAKEPMTVAYARVSSHDQKEDLARQKEALSLYCSRQGWQYEVVSDLGSGMNYGKKGLNDLLDRILKGSLGRLVLMHKDRLLRFGAELIFALCAMQGVEVVIVNQGQEPSFEEELAQDALEIITVFSARLYGSRSRKNRKLIEGLKESWDAARSQN